MNTDQKFPDFRHLGFQCAFWVRNTHNCTIFVETCCFQTDFALEFSNYQPADENRETFNLHEWDRAASRSWKICVICVYLCPVLKPLNAYGEKTGRVARLGRL